MKRQIPFALTTLRLLLGPVALGCALAGATRWVYAPILVTATLSDIYDGILARRWGVSTHALRRYDSVTDAIFYLFVLATIWTLRRAVIVAHWPAIALLFLSELAVLAVSFARFGKYPAAHTYLAKFYGLCLPVVLIGVLTFEASGWTITGLAVVAAVTNGEIVAIHFRAKTPPVDVKSIFSM